jgi:hypothetical protein
MPMLLLRYVQKPIFLYDLDVNGFTEPIFLFRFDKILKTCIYTHTHNEFMRGVSHVFGGRTVGHMHMSKKLFISQ